jgi:hypothetical protein
MVSNVSLPLGSWTVPAPQPWFFQSSLTRDGQSVSQSVCQGIEPTLKLVTRYYFLPEGCCLKVAVLSLWGALSDERPRFAIVSSYITPRRKQKTPFPLLCLCFIVEICLLVARIPWKCAWLAVLYRVHTTINLIFFSVTSEISNCGSNSQYNFGVNSNGMYINLSCFLIVTICCRWSEHNKIKKVYVSVFTYVFQAIPFFIFCD